jgi:SRSO17 transposase
VEPIALRMLGEKGVRPMQQLLARPPLPEPQLEGLCRSALAGIASAPGGMLSCDETSFIKKGANSAGVKRQCCGRLGKTENCQVGVFLAYASPEGSFGLAGHELYIPESWFGEGHAQLRSACGSPEGQQFETKNARARRMLNSVLEEGLFDVSWIGCDSVYGSDHGFLDGLEKPEGVWPFAATNSKERAFLSRPAELPAGPEGRGRPRKHPLLSLEPVSAASVASDGRIPWEEATLAEGSKGPIKAKVKRLRCVACRADDPRSYTKAGRDIWLYIRAYANGDIKYFVSDAPEDMPASELDRAASLRWPIEQRFQECKGFLGMPHYECRTLQGWRRHMLFAAIAHLFVRSLQLSLKKTAFPPL